VDTFGVVERQVLGQLGVEGGGVTEEEIGVEIDELVLDRSVKALAVSVHLRCLRVRVVVGDTAIIEERVHVLLELAPIVSEYGVYGIRK